MHDASHAMESHRLDTRSLNTGPAPGVDTGVVPVLYARKLRLRKVKITSALSRGSGTRCLQIPSFSHKKASIENKVSELVRHKAHQKLVPLPLVCSPSRSIQTQASLRVVGLPRYPGIASPYLLPATHLISSNLPSPTPRPKQGF